MGGMRKIIPPINPWDVETCVRGRGTVAAKIIKGKGNPMGQNLAFEESVALVDRRLVREPRYRLALYRLLGFCEQERTLAEIEGEVVGYPEMAVSPYGARTLLSWLVESDAIRCTNEEEAEEATVAKKTGGTADDGIAYRFATTVVGSQVLANWRESKPLAQLMARYPQYEEAFCRVMAACGTPLARQEVEALFTDDPILEEPKKIYPNFFLDKLEAAGGLVFKGGWTATPEGSAILAERNAAAVIGAADGADAA